MATEVMSVPSEIPLLFVVDAVLLPGASIRLQVTTKSKCVRWAFYSSPS